MKLYVGTREIVDESYKKISDPDMLNYIADDSECTTIVLDNVCSKLDMDSVVKNLVTASKKLRIGGKLILSDIDFDLINYVYSKNPNPMDLNKLINSIGGIRSILTYQLLVSIIESQTPLTLDSVKLSNIEFKLEYTRNA